MKQSPFDQTLAMVLDKLDAARDTGDVHEYLAWLDVYNALVRAGRKVAS